MGQVLADITVKNAFDVGRVNIGQIAESDVRTVSFTAIVDTGATTLVINEEILSQLGLTIRETRDINLAGGAKVQCKVTEPVQIHWKNRCAEVNAVVLPEGKPLLGVMPLEFMDLMIDPVNRELVGVHGDQAVLMAM
jgi:clan AA aspartic protease